MEQARPAVVDQALVALTRKGGRTDTGGGWPERLIALLLGLAAFWLVVGPAPLDPRNIAWLGQADAVTNYLGWAFYRSSPWTWPIAANPAYGMDIAGSVMMADANPLLAIPFKLLSPLLPAPFQYFGGWLLLCFLLQAWFAHGIARRIAAFPEQRLAIALLFLFAPFFLIRIATAAVFHMTLCGQWQILAAFYLYLSPDLRRRTLGWTLLLAAAVLTHPYLLALVGAIWLADLLRSLIAAREPLLHILGSALVAVAVPVALAELTGVFWLQGADTPSTMATMNAEWGFAQYKANLLSPVDAQGWSRLLPDIATKPEQIEGFAFLGLGTLLLAVAAFAGWKRWRPLAGFQVQHLPLLLILFGCALFAFSNRVELGSHAFDLAWPRPLIGIGNMFRSTGRFIWPVAYALMLLAVWGVARGWRRPVASLLLIAAALIQVADTSPGWRAYAATFARQGSAWPTSLRSPFWTQAGKRYTAVRLAVPRNHAEPYRDLGVWALANNMRTEIVYLARFDTGALDRLRRLRTGQVRQGTLPRDTLWVLDGMSAEQIARLKRHPGDFVGTVDGIPLFAPDLGARRPL